MANIRKAFNFRSGLQVDNDNFVINANGLVGIGTSIPQNYFLNVYGDKGLRVTGLTTTQDLNVSRNVEISGITTVGVLTASSIDVANGVNVGGALTAATLKLANGDTVDNLIGFARTTFIADGVGIHTVSKIGIGTTSNVNYQLDVLGDTRVTGIVSATNFIGILTGTATNASGATGDFSIADKIIHTGDTDTTIRFPAADTFTVETAGTERLRITGIGSVGIGTDNPAQKLEVYGSARITSTDGSHGIELYPDVTGLGFQRIISYNRTSSAYENLSFGVNDFIVTNGVTAERLRVTSAGNVGIGSTIPTSKLDVSGDAKVSGVITATTFVGNLTGVVNASSGVSTFTELKVGTAITMSAGIVTATTFDGNLTGGVTGVVNASSGVSTFTELKVGTAITMSAGIVTATTFDGNVTGTATTATNLSNGANITTGTINNDRLPTTPQFTSVGIGTDSPTDALHIQQSGAAEIYVGSDSAASSLRVGRNLDDNTSGMVKYGNTSGIYPLSTENSLDFMNFGWGNVNFYLQAGITTTSDLNFNWNVGGFNNLMTLTRGGNLGIGITNPTQKLNVQGISTFTGNANFDQDVTIVGALSADSLTLTQSLSANLTGDVTGNVTGNLSGDVNGSLAGISTFNYIKSSRVGIGTTTPRCALDIKDSTASGSGFVLLPSQTTLNRPGAGSTITGALIFNEDLARFEFWNGTAWVGLTTEA